MHIRKSEIKALGNLGILVLLLTCLQLSSYIFRLVNIGCVNKDSLFLYLKVVEKSVVVLFKTRCRD